MPADCSDLAALSELRAAIGAIDQRVSSPARRCLETAAALWPGAPLPLTDPRLWEQDFGAWEGLAAADVPDCGQLGPEALAALKPPQGESFAELCARATPGIAALAAGGRRVAVVAHAGIVRAALGLALGPAAWVLAVEVAPLSLTSITRLASGQWAVGVVNWTAPGAGNGGSAAAQRAAS